MELVVQGDIDGGVAELEVAYEILPHPNVLYNIGRAYAEAGRYEDALDYFNRYLASGPPDTEEVRGYINALEQRLAARAAVAEAREAEATQEAVTESTETPTTTGVHGTAEEIAALRATADRLDALGSVIGGSDLSARATTLRRLADAMEHANTAQATTTPTTTETSESTGPEGVVHEEIRIASANASVYEERFVSSTRAAVDPLDAPNSTTIITRQDIRLTGITAIGELLRRVAGVQVMTASPSETNVGIRGFNQRISPRVLLLINGRSTYVDALGITMWQQQPVSVEDIERIEVVRGPASALYGANGFSGIVNIITRAPGEDPSTEFSVSGGTDSQVRGYFGTSGRGGREGRIGYRVSVSFEQADRFTRPLDPRRVDVYLPENTTDPDLAQRSMRAFGNLTYRIGRSAEAYAEAGTTYLNPSLISGASVFNDLYMRGATSYGVGGITSGWGGLRFFWNGFNVDSDQYGLGPYTTNLRSNTYDLEGTFAHEFTTGAVRQHLVAGVGYRRKFVDWSIFEHAYDEDHFQGFAQDSIQLGQRFTIVAGLRIDRHPLLAHPVFSPRGAVVGRIGERQAIRASVSTAFRTQNFLESYASTFQPTPISAISAYGAGSAVNASLFGIPPMNPERILSAEVGYQNSESDIASFDAAVYFNRVQDLIDIRTDVRYFGLTDSSNPTYANVSGFNTVTNTYVIGSSGFQNLPGTFYVGGLELVGRLNPIEGLDVWANYSLNITYLDANGDLTRKTRAPAHQANVGVQYRGSISANVGFDLAVDFHAQSKTIWDEQTFSNNAVSVQPFALDALYMINARVGVRLLDDRLSLGVVGYNINGFWGEDFRQHPMTQPIGARVLGNVSYRF